MKTAVLAVVGIALILLSAVIQPLWILFGVVGVLAGLGLRGLLRLLRRPRRARISLAVLGGLAACIVLAFVVFIQFQTLGPTFLMAPSFGRVKYSCYIRYAPETPSWVVKDDILVLDTVELQRKLRKLRRGPEDKADLSQILSSCGWEQQGTVDSMLQMVQTRTISVNPRWWPVHKVSQIEIPQMACQGIHLNLDAASRAVLNVPKYMVAKTYPAAPTRTETLVEDEERLVLPLDFVAAEPQVVRLEVVSPPARNKLGFLIVKGAIWKPLNGIFMVLCGIFSEQIKKGLLIPIVKRLFRVLHIPFKEDPPGTKSEPDEVSEQSTGGDEESTARES